MTIPRDFNWQNYLNMNPDLSIYTEEFARNHYLEYGILEKRRYSKLPHDFDWELYLIMNPDLTIKNQEFAETHYLKYGIQEKRKFHIKKEVKLEERKNILYYVGTTSHQSFNTGIQRVTRNLSHIIGNYFNEYNLFLVTFDDDFKLINSDELNTFMKFNGYNHLDSTWQEKNDLFNKIKQQPQNILLIPELFYTDQYHLLDKVIEKSKTYQYVSAHIYYDDTIYNNVEIEKNTRIEIFDTYMRMINKIDIVIPISEYSKSTYLYHKYRLNLNSDQKVEAVLLSGEALYFKRLVNKQSADYIFANISVSRRKNAKTLIKAFHMLRNNYPGLKLIICGVVYSENEYYNEFKNYLNENVIFSGEKSDAEILELYKNCLFSVYPSLEEGFGLPILESLWCNTPVICHNETSTHEIFNNINYNAVSSINCSDVVELYDEMYKFMDKEYLQNMCKEIKQIKLKTWYNYGEEIVNILNKKLSIDKIIKKTIYYYVDHTCIHNCRTGIQIVTIYLAKQLYKKMNGIDIIFVRWCNINLCLVPCDSQQINHLFNYNETEDFIENVEYASYEPIHLTLNKDSVLIFPELPIPEYIIHLVNYTEKLLLKTIVILYDLIPLVLKNKQYSQIYDYFDKYIKNLILKSNKIITISNFTKTELLDYVKSNRIKDIPVVEACLLPYQYRNKNQVINENDGKITILLPGTIEPRKQQITLIKLFNKFIKLNPNIDIELITFGSLWYPQEILDAEITESKGKIKYMGFVSNEQLFDLYKTASFSCFISTYEGYGFPISESLWHGTPVLTANFGAMYEVAQIGGCYCIDTNNETEIYEAMEKLIKEPEILVKLKNEISRANFTTWENYADQIYKMI